MNNKNTTLFDLSHTNTHTHRKVLGQIVLAGTLSTLQHTFSTPFGGLLATVSPATSPYLYLTSSPPSPLHSLPLPLSCLLNLFPGQQLLLPEIRFLRGVFPLRVTHNFSKSLLPSLPLPPGEKVAIFLHFTPCSVFYFLFSRRLFGRAQVLPELL